MESKTVHTENTKEQFPATNIIQKQEKTQSGVSLQDNRTKSVLQRKQTENSFSRPVHNTIQKKTNNTGLPDHLKSGIENLSGHSMNDVKVHYNSSEPAQLNAHAYAQGTDIHIASGQEKHLPHEAWHVVQQKQGRVKPTLQMKGKVNVNDDKGLENEADVMGAKAVQLTVYEPRLKLQSTSNSLHSDADPVQRMTFTRFNWKQNPLNWGWKYNKKEQDLLALEKNTEKEIALLDPYINGTFRKDIFKIAGEFHFISKKEYDEANYDEIHNELLNLLKTAEDLFSKISSANLADPHMNAVLKTKSGKGAFTKEVIKELLKVYTALPPAMNNAKNKELIKEAIYPDAGQASGFFNDDMAASTTKFAKTRGVLLTKNFNQLNNRIINSWQSIKIKFNIDGDLKNIELTGSDFHNSGQQVAIVESTTGKKIVYKPRSISPDAMLTQENNSAFHDLNTLSKNKLKLPTMKFQEEKDKEGTFSFVEYQQKEREQTVAEIQNHYVRYGELVVASKLLGVNDLHNENIMSKKGTPTIIDAETAFLPFVMQEQSFAKTEIGMTLNSFKKHMGSDEGENFFYTAAEKNIYDLNPDGKGDFVTYINTLRKQDLSGQKNYLPYFKKGLDNVINLVKTKQEEVVKILLSRMKQVKHVRVVPFKTQDFQDSIRTYRSLLVQNNQEMANQVVAGDVTKMKNAIKLKGFMIITDEWAPSVTSKVGKALKEDYEAADTPILHFEPSTNQLLFHGQDVGLSESWESHKSFIKQMVYKIYYANKDTIMNDLNVNK